MDTLLSEKHQLIWAAWTSLTTALVSLSRDWEDRTPPPLYWGEDQLPLKRIQRLKPEQFGLHGGYFKQHGHIHFVLPASLTRGLDLSRGLFLASSFNGWEAAIGNREWRLSPGLVRGRQCHTLRIREQELAGLPDATFKFVTGTDEWIEVPEDTANVHVDAFGIKNYLFCPHRSGAHLFKIELPLPLSQSEDRHLFLKIDGIVQSIRLSPGIFLKSLKTDSPLGANVESNQTAFRLFAPRAARVDLYVFSDHDGPEGPPIRMRFTESLVWEAILDGNLHGAYYHYRIRGLESNEVGYFNPEFRVLDPYAKATCGPQGPAIVVDDAVAFETPPQPFTPPRWHDLIIAEAHVRDLSAHAPVPLSPEQRLGFDGLRHYVETDDFYLAKLGVNAVELQPVHQYDATDREQYQWGYMPVNYFSPASQYASDPTRLTQIHEFKGLVEALHRKGLAVILDVVYNHVGEPNYLQYLDREYYFLLTGDGHHENFSGCGNTIDASTPMARRLIRDSLVHWITAYGVDGFRFDLGELIGRETLAWLEKELKAVRPEVILIAEPWSFRAHIGKELRETGFASWNDHYRETVREYILLRGNTGALRHAMLGSAPDWSRFPAQSVNYLASHDDRCWIDRITENPLHDGHRPTANDRRRTHLAVAILMSSIGIPMIASGMDMLKSKGGAHNTYLQGHLNAIPYCRMSEYPGTVAYFREWIAFRRGPLGRYLRLDTFPEGYVLTGTADPCFGILFNAGRQLGPERLFFVVNPGFEYAEFHLPETDLSSFVQIADTERWGHPVLGTPHFCRRGNGLFVPPLSCGLFLEK
jgi:pullulanase